MPADPSTNDSPDTPGTAEAPYTPGYSRVSPAQATEMVRLRRLNPKITLQQIATAVGVRSISTVSHWLSELDNDTVPEARKLMKTHALRSAMKITDQIDHDDPRVSQGAAKAVLQAAGVAETGPQVQVGVQVIVGSVGAPAGPDPFDAITTVDAMPVTG